MELRALPVRPSRRVQDSPSQTHRFAYRRTHTRTHAHKHRCTRPRLSGVSEKRWSLCELRGRERASARGSARGSPRRALSVSPSAAPGGLVPRHLAQVPPLALLLLFVSRFYKMGFWQHPGCGRRRLLLTGKWSVSVGSWRWPWRCWCGWERWFTCWCWAGGGCRSSVPEQEQ